MFTQNRRMVWAGLMRRLGLRGVGTALGLGFLLSYYAATFVRGSEAAYTDPREGDAFADTTSTVLFATWPVIGSWTPTGTPTLVTGVTDPRGGTDAVTTGDDSITAFEYHQGAPGTVLVPGADYVVELEIRKESSITNYPEFQVLKSGETLAFRFDPVAGAYTTVTDTWSRASIVTVVTHPSDPGWWLVQCRVVPNSTAGLIVNVIPGRSATLAGANDVTLTGEITWVPDGTKAYDMAAWKRANVARIFSDGAVLIEGAAAQLVQEPSDVSTWAPTGAPIETPGQLAPDGTLSATTIEDDDAAAFELHTITCDAMTVTGDHAASIFVKKDSDETRFPEFQVFQGTAIFAGGICAIGVNTSTGATAVRLGTPVAHYTIDEGDWWRVVVVVDVTTAGTFGIKLYAALGTTIAVAAAAAVGSITVWNLQVEAGSFPTSPIRDGSSTRAADDMKIPVADVPATFRTGRWAVTVTPTWASADAPSIITYIFSADGGNYLCFASGQYLRLVADGNIHQINLGAFPAGTAWDIIVDFPAGLMTVDGVGSVALLADWSDWGVAPNLQVGAHTSGVQYLDGVLSRPRAA